MMLKAETLNAECGNGLRDAGRCSKQLREQNTTASCLLMHGCLLHGLSGV